MNKFIENAMCWMLLMIWPAMLTCIAWALHYKIGQLNTRIEEIHNRIDYLHTYNGFNKMKCKSRGGILIGTWESDGKDRLVIKSRCMVDQQGSQKEIEL